MLLSKQKQSTRSKSLNKTFQTINNTNKPNFQEAAILSMSDLERIRKNATILSKEQEMNSKKILEDQKEFALANAYVFILNLNSS